MLAAAAAVHGAGATIMQLKHLSTIGIASALALGMANPAYAAPLCPTASENTVGNWQCIETVQTSASPTELVVAIFLDKWVSTAAPGFVQTLTGVTITLGGSIDSTGSITNHSAQTQSFTVTLSSDFTYTAGPGTPANLASHLPLIASGTTGAEPFSLAPGASTSYSANFSVGPSPLTIAGTLVGFVGPGTFQLDATTATQFAFAGGGGNLQTNLTTLAAARAVAFSAGGVDGRRSPEHSRAIRTLLLRHPRQHRGCPYSLTRRSQSPLSNLRHLVQR